MLNLFRSTYACTIVLTWIFWMIRWIVFAGKQDARNMKKCATKTGKKAALWRSKEKNVKFWANETRKRKNFLNGVSVNKTPYRCFPREVNRNCSPSYLPWPVCHFDAATPAPIFTHTSHMKLMSSHKICGKFWANTKDARCICHICSAGVFVDDGILLLWSVLRFFLSLLVTSGAFVRPRGNHYQIRQKRIWW